MRLKGSKMGKRTYKRCIIMIGTMVLIANAAMAQSIVDNQIYANLLEKYVSDGQVDYHGFKNDEGRLDQYLRVLEAISPDLLDHNGQFAFYVNVYNAWTIKLILSAYPGIESIKELGGVFTTPWKKKIVRIEIFYLPGNPGMIRCDIKPGDLADPGFAGAQCLPGFLNPDTQWGNGSQACNHNPPIQNIFLNYNSLKLIVLS